MKKTILAVFLGMLSLSCDNDNNNDHTDHNAKIKIPVVVNVLYYTPEENISLQQIQSQIDALNECYNAKNADFNSVPDVFKSVRANVGVEFVLDRVNRKQTNVEEWEFGSEDIKITANGGLDPTNPEKKLNIYTVGRIKTNDPDLEGNAYADSPVGNIKNNGIVISHYYFGRTGTAKKPYNQGKAAVHEVGHWLGLDHIFVGENDGDCIDDKIADTPVQDREYLGNPSFPTAGHCPSSPIVMTMNFMQLTDDVTRNMFTNGQKQLIHSKFVPGSVWYNYLIK